MSTKIEMESGRPVYIEGYAYAIVRFDCTNNFVGVLETAKGRTASDIDLLWVREADMTPNKKKISVEDLGSHIRVRTLGGSLLGLVLEVFPFGRQTLRYPIPTSGGTTTPTPTPEPTPTPTPEPTPPPPSPYRGGYAQSGYAVNPYPRGG